MTALSMWAPDLTEPPVSIDDVGSTRAHRRWRSRVARHLNREVVGETDCARQTKESGEIVSLARRRDERQKEDTE
jgi:hypothetical protein